MSELFAVEVEQRDGVVVARVTGELDLSDSARAGQLLGEAVPSAARGLVADLTQLRFIDSSGVAMLFALARRLGSRRQGLRVVAPPGSTVERVLEIVDLRRAAPLAASVQDALADLR